MEENNDFTILPKALTAENGAKGLLTGEFFEAFEICENGSEEPVLHNIAVSWTTIKEIYATIVKYYGKTLNQEDKNV